MAAKKSPAKDTFGPESCVLYLRISSDPTGQQLGVQRQEKECRDLAKRLGLAVADVLTDNDISATSGKVRPGFEQLLASRPEAVVAWHQDRLLRLTRDLERVIDLGVPVHFVTAGSLDLSTPAGRAVARTVAAWSQYEGEQKSLRQQAANRQRAERGAWHFSRRPFGYQRINGSVVIVPVEAEVVREVFTRYRDGDSLYAIAADLNDRGVPTMDPGTRWSMRRVQQIIANAHYAGIVSYGGEVVEAEPSWEPIIGPRLWADVTATRTSRTRASSWSTSTRHLLSGLARCGTCGGPMQARPDHGRPVYACTKWHAQIQQEPVDALVEAVIVARLRDPRIVKALRQEPATEPVEAELRDLRARRDDVLDLLAAGVLDRRAARERAEDLTAAIEATQARLNALRSASPVTDLALAESVPERWQVLPVLDRRRAVAELGLVVTVGKGKPGRRPRDADGESVSDLGRVTISWEADQ